MKRSILVAIWLVAACAPRIDPTPSAVVPTARSLTPSVQATLISPSQLTVGDRISVRIRARGNASLSDVEATPANHVGEHEPTSS